jgi:ABC-2 type transport system permease protein
MSKMLLIFRHELTNTVRTTWYIVLTVAVPLVALLGIGVYVLISRSATPSAPGEATIGYVDQVGGFDGFTRQDSISLVRFATPEEATGALTREDVKAYFVIPSNYVATGVVNLYTLQRQVAVPAETTTAISNFLLGNLLAGKVPPSTIARAEVPLKLVTTTLTETGAVAPEQGGAGPVVIGLALAILLIFSTGFSSSMMIYGVGEEKENRLMEILLSSVSTRQLLAGKVLGLGAAGLVQIAVWLISAPLIVNTASSRIGGFFTSLQAPTGLLALTGVYFVLTYMLFAVLTAGIGAVSPTTREGQQLASGLMLLMVPPIWFTAALILNPDHPVVVALSIFPITSSVVMVIRSGVTDIPAWQVAVSLAVLLLTTVGGLILGAKLFRMYLLMYGRRPRLGEVISSLRR